MGNLLPAYKKAVIDEITNSISANLSQYYAFAAFSSNTNNLTADQSFAADWQLLFGKKLSNTNILPIINNIVWTSNTKYTQYDNTKNLSNANFYVVVPPGVVGGDYVVYKCLNNGGNSYSTYRPDQIQASSFSKPDGYTWRYITSISSLTYDRFATSQYVPLYPNNSIVSSAAINSGIENIVITNQGSGYKSYSYPYVGIGNIVRSAPNTTVIQIEDYEKSNGPDFYTLNAILFYNTGNTNQQISSIKQHIVNASGSFVLLDTAVNTSLITPSVTQYSIAPKVIFNTDAPNANSIPQAFVNINTTSNSIYSISIINPGSSISWANVVIQSNNSYPADPNLRANVYAICPPPGGHGSSPASELFVQGLAINFEFDGSENNTIPIETSYSTIGILKNPYSINSASFTKGSQIYSTSFSSVLKANISPSVTFTVGDTVKGSTSNAVGTVVFSNSSVIYLTGDKYFSNSGETIISSNGSLSTTMSAPSTVGDVYTKDILPLYIQTFVNSNIVTARANNQSESYKMTILI